MQVSMLVEPLKIAATGEGMKDVLRAWQDMSSEPVAQVRDLFQSGFRDFVNKSDDPVITTLSSSQENVLWQMLDSQFQMLWPQCVDELMTSGSSRGDVYELLSSSSPPGESSGSQQRSSSLPRDVDLTNRLNSPRKKKSKKR